MRKVTRLGVKNPEAKRKPGRPKKQRESIVEQMSQSEDPDIHHVRDLTHYDRSEVLAPEDGFKRRWCRADKIGERQRQGYTKDESEGITTSHDGGFWPPEGKDTRRANGGMVLMKIPKSLHEKRTKIKEEKAVAASNSEELRFRSGVRDGGGAVLPDSDPFVQELERS